MRKIIALSVVAALTLSGCGAAAKTTTTTPRPSAAADTTRQACHELSSIPQDIDDEFNPTNYVAVVDAAKTARDPGVAAAGARLRGVVAANEKLSEDDRRGEPNLNLAQATLAVSRVCGNLYGDGPW